MNTLQIEPKDTVPNSDADFVLELHRERRSSWGQWIMVVMAVGLALAMIIGLAPAAAWDRALGGAVLVLFAFGIWQRRCRPADAPAMGARLLDLGPRDRAGSIVIGVGFLVMAVRNFVLASSPKLFSNGAFLLLAAGAALTERRKRRCLMERGVWDQGRFYTWETFEGYEWGEVWIGTKLNLWRRSNSGRLRRLGLRPTPVTLSVRPDQIAAVEAIISRFVPREGPLPTGLQPAGEQGATQRGPQEDHQTKAASNP